MHVFTFTTCSRFMLIVDNAVPLSESRDFVDQKMVTDIIGHHTDEHHQHIITDTLLSHSDYEQVCIHIAIFYFT